MDLELEELQFLGVAGIFGASAGLIANPPHHRRLFGQIAGALVLPLSLLFLAHIHISHILFIRIDSDEHALERAPPDSSSESRLLSILSSDWSLFLLFKAIYLLFVLVFSLLSTSAVVYSVASIFTAKDINFKKVFAVVPKVWKRLMLTFLWAVALLVAYHVLSAAVMLLYLILFGESSAAIAIFVLIVLAYLAGLVWISVVWHVASVVSVLEDLCGVGAMRKSRELIRGKGWTAVGIFLLLNIGFGAIELGFRMLVVKGEGMGVGARLLCGALMLVLLVAVILLGLVVQTVVYFVCKSYHHESIDKSSLADHLEVYLGEYVPLKGRDVQMEQYSMA